MRYLRLLPLLFAAGVSFHCSAEPQHMLDYLLPRGGTRGTVVEVTLYGRSLDNPKEITFYGPGIKVLSISPETVPHIRARIEIAKDCPLGEHVLRLRTATSLSEAVTFWVSPFPTVMETEKKIGDNDSIAKAQPVPLNSTVEGQIQPGANQSPEMDRDFYRVEAKQGQRLSVEMESVRLGTMHTGSGNDLMVTILNSDGKELARSMGSALYVEDPILSIIAPGDGSYYVVIQQQIYETPRQAHYRVHIGTFSRPTAIYPAGGEAGTTVEARIIGDPTGPRVEPIALPRLAARDFPYFAGTGDDQPPSPNMLRVSPYPNVLHAEGGSPTGVAALPAALNGIIEKPGETQTFRFSAKKGERWKVRVYARTLGSPMDPKIWIRSVNAGKHLLDADDARLADLDLPAANGNWHLKDQLDPVTIFTAPEDGEYIFGIEDTRGAGGPDFVYRAEIESVRNAVYAQIVSPLGYQMARYGGLIVPQGNRWTLEVQLTPGLGNTYKGDMELEARGLPPGVTMIAPRFEKGALREPVQFVAEADAEPCTALIELLARPVGKYEKIETGSRQAFALVNRPSEQPLHFVLLETFALAVTEPAPFSVQLEQPEIPLAQNGELALKVKINRSDSFKDPVEIMVDTIPNGLSRDNAVTIPADKSEAEFRIRATDKAAAGAYQIAISASSAKGGDAYSGVGRLRASSPFVKLQVAESYLSVELKRSSVERGQHGEIVAKLQVKRPFPGKASVGLLRLPKGVTMSGPPPEITAQDKEVSFPIEASADALLGLYKDVACEIKVMENGQTVKQQSGSGVLRVDPARGVEP